MLIFRINELIVNTNCNTEKHYNKISVFIAYYHQKYWLAITVKWRSTELFFAITLGLNEYNELRPIKIKLVLYMWTHVK